MRGRGGGAPAARRAPGPAARGPAGGDGRTGPRDQRRRDVGVGAVLPRRPHGAGVHGREPAAGVRPDRVGRGGAGPGVVGRRPPRRSPRSSVSATSCAASLPGARSPTGRRGSSTAWGPGGWSVPGSSWSASPPPTPSRRSSRFARPTCPTPAPCGSGATTRRRGRTRCSRTRFPSRITFVGWKPPSSATTASCWWPRTGRVTSGRSGGTGWRSRSGRSRSRSRPRDEDRRSRGACWRRANGSCSVGPALPRPPSRWCRSGTRHRDGSSRPRPTCPTGRPTAEVS